MKLEMSEFENYLRSYLNQHLSHLKDLNPYLLRLYESIQYSLINGGKRFRPMLCLVLGTGLGASLKRMLPYALSVELVHTYSLVHDDLPSLDNDDFRRGQPTNHKIYGEALALLAGDALLTESFGVLARSYSDQPVIATKLIQILSEGAGVFGMVGGQVIDVLSESNIEKSSASESKDSILKLEKMHKLKTGALMRASTLGAGCIAGVDSKGMEKLSNLGWNLGLAFQIADDILDIHQESETPHRSLASLLGMEACQNRLKELSDSCIENISGLPLSTESHLSIAQLVEFNYKRTELPQ